MLTFSEALTLLKSGEDMRCAEWPPDHFVRLMRPQQVPPQGFHGQPYNPTQPEMLGQQWSKA